MAFHPPSELQSADRESTDQVLNTAIKKMKKHDCLEISYKSKEDSKGKLFYATRGLPWTSSYLVNLNSKSNEVNISLQVILQNEMDCDFDARELAVTASTVQLEHINQPDLLTYRSSKTPSHGNSLPWTNRAFSSSRFVFSNVTLRKNAKLMLDALKFKTTHKDEGVLAVSEGSVPSLHRSMTIANETKFDLPSGVASIFRDDAFVGQTVVPQTPQGSNLLLALKDSTVPANEATVSVHNNKVEVKNQQQKPIKVFVARSLPNLVEVGPQTSAHLD
jgi:hypothetical protein